MGKGGKGNKGVKEGSAKKSAKAGLIAPNGALEPKFRHILKEIFSRFDADKDGALSIEELEAFAKASGTGSQISKEERKQLSTYFDTDTKGNLTSKGFEQMYLMQTNHQPEDTWRDLEKLGYSKSLELLQPLSTEEEAAERTKAQMDEMRAALGELKLNPQSATAHRRVGESLDALGRSEQAQKAYLQAAELERQAGLPPTEDSVVELQD